MRRRAFLESLAVAAAATLAPPRALPLARQRVQRYLRPPGALAEAEFAAACIRCGQCGEICPNRCIRYFGLENGFAARDTPYIVPREKGCILCMKCTQACPSGALRPLAHTAEAILANVRMGRAVVDRRLCLSWQGKSCGVCYRACPLQDVAIRVGMMEQPHVNDHCVGCGLCERSCIQMPQAIRVIPESSGAGWPR